MERLPKLAALAVVIRGAEVLLVRRRNEPDAGLWGFPGGHVEFGETALDAAERELLEETSVTARATGYLTNVDVIVRDAQDAITHHFLLAAVLCDYVNGHPTPQDDVSGADWHAVEAVFAGQVACSRNVDKVLRAALSARAEAEA